MRHALTVLALAVAIPMPGLAAAPDPESSVRESPSYSVHPVGWIRKSSGKTYIEITDYEKLRGLFGDMLHEIQRIKSEGDYAAGKALVENYGVKVDQKLHDEVLARYGKLHIEPFSGFVNPVYKPVMENGEIVDVTVEYTEDYPDQMMRYSKNYSFLPSVN